MIKKLVCAGSAALITLGLLTDCSEKPIRDLKLSPQSPPRIYLSAEATPAEKYAAEELSTALEKMLRMPVPITLPEEIKKVGKGSFPIFVGRQPQNEYLHPERLEVEESVVDIQPDGIHLIGGWSKEDHPPGEQPWHNRGTLYAVYDFLESLGVRWFRPEDWGEHIPQRDEIKLTLGKTTHQPIYKYRYGINHYQTFTPFDKQVSNPEKLKEVQAEREMARRWAVRNRLNGNLWTDPKYGGYYEVDFAHAYHSLVPPQRYFKEHPEYFALVNGKRSSDPNAQLCLGNPEVEDKVFEALLRTFKDRPHLEIASIDPNDYAIWCECDLCRAMDDPNLKAGHSSDQMPEKIQGISMANRVVTFGNRIARRLAEVLPDKRVGWYAYHMHTEVPTRVDHLEPNVSIMPVAFAGSFSDYSRSLYDPESRQNARFLKILQGYAALSKKNQSPMFAHDYWSFYMWPGPLPVMHSMEDKLKHYHRDFGVRGVYNEVHPCWGPQGMPLYFYTWLLRNPEADIEQEKEIYYQGYYGPAAVAMKDYHEYLEQEAWEGKTYFGSGGSSIEPLFTKQRLEKMEGFIRQAIKLTHGKAPYEQRVQSVAAGLEYAKLVRRAIDQKSAGQSDKAMETIDKLQELFYSFPDGSVFDSHSSVRGNWDKIFDRYRKDFGVDKGSNAFFDSPKLAQQLKDGWKFRTDPDNIGEKERWYAGTDGADWTGIEVSQPWQNQGFSSYHGTAWYRTSWKPSAITSGKRLILYFDAVDGDATVYLNGEKIGEHLLDPKTGAGYEHPFFFDISDVVKLGQSNQLAIRIKKDRFLSGITGGVKLLEVDRIRPPE